jgi:cytoskeletal protein CcmA (bactofilin family)
MPSLWPSVPTRAASAMTVTPNSTLGPGIYLRGEVHGEDTLVMHGVLEGDIVLDGTLQAGADGAAS